jgi:hypothetical protein
VGERAAQSTVVRQIHFGRKKDPISGKSNFQNLLRNIIAECSDPGTFNSKIPRRTSRGRHRIHLGSCKVIVSTCSCISKEGRENFKQLVRDSTCPINELSIERVETFAARAHAYICTYHHVFEMRQRRQQEHQASESIESLEGQGLLLSDIQRLTLIVASSTVHSKRQTPGTRWTMTTMLCDYDALDAFCVDGGS